MPIYKNHLSVTMPAAVAQQLLEHKVVQMEKGLQPGLVGEIVDGQARIDYLLLASPDSGSQVNAVIDQLFAGLKGRANGFVEYEPEGVRIIFGQSESPEGISFVSYAELERQLEL